MTFREYWDVLCYASVCGVIVPDTDFALAFQTIHRKIVVITENIYYDEKCVYSPLVPDIPLDLTVSNDIRSTLESLSINRQGFIKDENTQQIPAYWSTSRLENSNFVYMRHEKFYGYVDTFAGTDVPQQIYLPYHKIYAAVQETGQFMLCRKIPGGIKWSFIAGDASLTKDERCSLLSKLTPTTEIKEATLDKAFEIMCKNAKATGYKQVCALLNNAIRHCMSESVYNELTDNIYKEFTN